MIVAFLGGNQLFLQLSIGHLHSFNFMGFLTLLLLRLAKLATEQGIFGLKFFGGEGAFLLQLGFIEALEMDLLFKVVDFYIRYTIWS